MFLKANSNLQKISLIFDEKAKHIMKLIRMSGRGYTMGR
jgi:hypothetical protein